jgi:hypothetical protein
MPMQEQAELWMALRDRMKESWTELTIQEKKAGKLPTPRPSLVSAPRHRRNCTPSRSLREAPGLQPGWTATDWRLPIDGSEAPRSCRNPLRHSSPRSHGSKSYHQQTAANTTCLSTAYWIAFGPHGPRSLPPPGENKKVALYTLIGLGVSLAIFATIRSFARPPPSTMTKEWQEATNEYLRVSAVYSTHRCYCSCSQLLTRHATTEPEVGPVDGYLVRRLLGQGPRAIPLGQAINERGFPLSIDAVSCAGRGLCDGASPARDPRGVGASGLAGADIGWCKYCTTLTMRNLSLLVASPDRTSRVSLCVYHLKCCRRTPC